MSQASSVGVVVFPSTSFFSSSLLIFFCSLGTTLQRISHRASPPAVFMTHSYVPECDSGRAPCMVSEATSLAKVIRTPSSSFSWTFSPSWKNSRLLLSPAENWMSKRMVSPSHTDISFPLLLVFWLAADDDELTTYSTSASSALTTLRLVLDLVEPQ